MRMKAVLVGVLTGLLALGVWGSRAEAASITYALDCIISGEGCTSSSSFGKINFLDGVDADADGFTDVQVTVDLNGDGVEKALQVFLNYDDNKFSNATTFGTVPTEFGVIVNEDQTKPDGYPCCEGGATGGLDLQIPDPPPGNLGFEPVTFSLTLAGTNLVLADFNLFNEIGGSAKLTASDLIVAAVHIGALNGGEDSIFVGAQTVIPEPSTLVLLGSGLAGLGAWGRKRLRRLRAK